MGIADLFRPKYRHSDVRVRVEAVKALTADDAAILIQVARTDRDASVRRLAIEKIDEAEALAEIAAGESERSLRDFAGERAAELWTAAACGDDADAAGAALSGVLKLGEQGALVDIAARAELPAIRKRAFGELRDPRALADLAKRDIAQDLRIAAVARIDDPDALRALAIDATQKEVALAAVDKLDDAERLEQVAQKAKIKAARQRARKIVQEMAEAEEKRRPGASDEQKRARAERAQLIREVEAHADSFDFAKAAEIVRASEAAWAKLGGETDEKFSRAVERFWKRKELHDQQARSADELRAVQREAQAERDRAAAEKKAAEPAAIAPAPAPVAPPVEPKLDDAERAAREAERAEREAKRQEDAARAAAIATSLRAMCDDMEQLAASKELRAIDRLLQQAQKAFDQASKVPVSERAALVDRYGAARGKLVARAGELREAEDWARFANVPKAEALIATAKEMATADATPDLGNRLRQLQALWKEVGPMPQRRSKELWEQFKAACDQVYDKVKTFRAGETERFADAAKIKEQLVAEAEALADSSDWVATSDKLKALQARWKESGHLPRKQGDELWKRFRAACDRFFDRRKPHVEAQRAEEVQNLEAKRALVARARSLVDEAAASGEWGRAIGEIKDLQRRWKDVGYVPRRDADAVYRAFRGACDDLFARRDAARDAEANTHRAELDAVKAEIDAVLATTGGDDVAARAPASPAPEAIERSRALIARVISARDRARVLDERGELAGAIERMIAHAIAVAPDAVKGTELDPAAARARRDKLIAKAEQLLPKQAEPSSADVATRLKEAMRANAFGDLRFSGRDPVEVVDELRAQWGEAGPIVDDTDRAQAQRFDDACANALDAAGAPGRQRKRRDSGASTKVASDPAVPVPAHDAVTKPATFEPLPPPPVPAAPPSEPPRRTRAPTLQPEVEEVDSGWDLGETDPTAGVETAAAESATTPPSSSEMAGDGATGGDGIDEPGWD
jgi:hypothetical protein